MSKTDDLLKRILPSPEGCRNAAAKLRAAKPKLSPDQLAEQAAKNARRWATVAGTASGAVANPFAMVPLAMGEMGVTLYREAKMAGVVAALLDPDSLADEDTFHTDVLAILFPGALSQALRELGVQAGKASTKALILSLIHI